ncbi:EamA family transporter RarD [Bacillus sp. PS06]|uniref:EamA family transporter RarD n=1 Tax=Bacillus sp. PS06 TaxID=2764176 RepID=UPI0017853260|nr:EamA family transporter RarD [Bacillus sp. PS06]MBD8067418.1 EamA family transporter RarD [Bacillus sp. PS06]
MQDAGRKDYNAGILYAFMAYLLWGVLPLYWKLLDTISAVEILAHRIVWSFVFVLVIIFLSKKAMKLKNEVTHLLKNRKILLGVILSSILVTGNWFIFIWAVNNNHIIETSLGYYINPLVSVLLGVLVLKERVSFWQTISFSLAGVGVLILTLQYGSFPWVSLTLAVTFGLYGLAKKLTNLDSLIGLMLETMLITPVALIFLVSSFVNGTDTFSQTSISQQLLLMGAGVATALPLLWFAQAARRIPLTMVGIIQYVSPTISLMIGVFLYNEEFTKTHMITFIFIWSALVIYSVSKTKLMLSLQPKIGKKRSIGA